MRNVNQLKYFLTLTYKESFILTMRNVNYFETAGYGTEFGGFILTMRNVNALIISFFRNLIMVLY